MWDEKTDFESMPFKAEAEMVSNILKEAAKKHGKKLRQGGEKDLIKFAEKIVRARKSGRALEPKDREINNKIFI